MERNSDSLDSLCSADYAGGVSLGALISSDLVAAHNADISIYKFITYPGVSVCHGVYLDTHRI